ncbi:MAG: hypothetical protein WCI01_09335 [Chlorobiaceae bacterium]
MNKRTRKNLALVAAVASLGASLGVAQAGDDWETHEIQGNNSGIIGPTDSHTIKWNDSKENSTQGTESNAIKWDNKANTIKSSSQSKGAHYSKFDG